MARVAYNRPFSQVGFRPSRQLTPFHAAHMSGLGYMGDDSSTLASFGFTSDQIQQIMTAHANGALSDPGYDSIVAGYVSPGDLSDYMTNVDPGAPDASSSPGSAAAGVPTGSILLYQATVNAHFWNRDASVVSGIAGTLTASGIQITSQAIGNASGLGNFTVQFQLQVVNAGFARPQDVQSIVDHAVYVQTGNMPLSSQIGLQSTPSTPGAGAAPSPSPSPFGTLNWTEVILGVAGIVTVAILARSFV